ncbi:MAG: response regulator [bacterium]|nr:response regulator [bacterium]
MEGENKKILIVEDDADFVKVLKDGLAQHGFSHVTSASDGEAGLQKAIEEKPDLILLDLILPKMRGEEFLKKLRGHEETHAVAVLIVSQLSDYEKISETMALGIKGYLVKSDFSLDSMIGQIQTILSEERKKE